MIKEDQVQEVKYGFEEIVFFLDIIKTNRRPTKQLQKMDGLKLVMSDNFYHKRKLKDIFFSINYFQSFRLW